MCSNDKGFVLWFTGLPCAGKTTIADGVAKELKGKGLKVERLDGDIIRQGLTRDLGFSKEDRDKNIERVTFVAKLLSRNGVATIVSFVSPYIEKRQQAREETTNFIEVYVRCPVEVCMKRDIKGMYAKAMRGEIKDFTGVNDPYEEPQNAELVLETDKQGIQESVDKVLNKLREFKFIKQSKKRATMKQIIFFVVLILFFQFLLTPPIFADDTKEPAGTVTISGAWALYPMVVKWAEEFQKIYPKVKIDVVAGGAGKGMVDVLADLVDIGMVSREIYPDEIKKGAWYVSVTKDAVVASISDKNPALDALLTRGVKKEVLIGIWIIGDIKQWGEIVDSDITQSIHVYTRSDACGAAETWAKYLGKKQEDLIGVGVYGDPGIAEAVKRDVLGIGFNNINFIYDPNSKSQIKGLRVLPIDLNDNGLLDKDENFYNTRDGIVNAIATGIYPSPPARELYLVCHGKPKKVLAKEFIKWTLTEGQRYVPEAGYINLTDKQLQGELKRLEGE